MSKDPWLLTIMSIVIGAALAVLMIVLGLELLL